MAGVRKTADMSQALARMCLSEMKGPPSARDVKTMFEKCREMPGTVIEWLWQDDTSGRTYLLTAKFPYFRDRDWWDYELNDDPDWCLSDDRAQGNNIIWEYKTSDQELVIEIVRMQQANARKASLNAGQGEAEQEAASAASQAAALSFKIDDQANHLYSAQTGLFKYESMLLFMQHEYQMFKEHGTPVSLIVFEIRVQGHDGQGNQWLPPEVAVEVAERVEKVKRPLDVFGHFQILDYALLLPNSDLKQATAYAETIGNMLMQGPFSVGAQKIKLVVSSGVANLPVQGSTLQHMYKAAVKAKDQAKLRHWLVVTAPPGEPTTAVAIATAPDAVQSPTSRSQLPSSSIQPTARQSGTHPAMPPRRRISDADLQLRDLLIRASLVSPEAFETAVNLSEKMHMPIPRVLAIEGHLRQGVVDGAQQVQAMLNSGKLSIEQAVKALKLVANHNLDLDTALKRLGLVDALVQKHPLAALLRPAGIIKKSRLERELRESLRVGLPLGFVLATKGLLSPPVRHAAVTLLRLMRDTSISRDKAVEALKAVDSGSSSLGRFLRDNGIDIPEQAAGVGELLVRGRLITDNELMIAREIELIEKKELEPVLIACGFVHQDALDLARELAKRVERDNLPREVAAEVLEKNKNVMGNPDVDSLTAEAMARKEAADAAEEAAAAAMAASRAAESVGEPSYKSAAATPDTEGECKDITAAADFESGMSQDDMPQTWKSETYDMPCGTAGESLSASSAGDVIELDEVEDYTLPPSGPDIGFDDMPQSWKSGTYDMPSGDSASALHPDADRNSLNMAPPAQSGLSTAWDPALDRSSVQKAPSAGASMLQDAPGAQPSTAPSSASKTNEPPKEVDRVDLLKRAAFINDKQIKIASSTASATKTSVIRALFDTGAIDQPVLNLSASAKRHIEAGDIDVEGAIRVLSYCREHKSSFDDAMRLLGGRSA